MSTRAVVAVVDDLLFQSRLEQQVQDLGYAFVAVDSEPDLLAKLDSAGVALAIVDLHVRGIDWRKAVSITQEAGLPVLAFGRHTDAQLLREARTAGCDSVVARSQLVEELPALIERLAPTSR